LGRDCHVFDGAVLGGRPQHLQAGQALGGLVVGARNQIRENATLHRALQPGRNTIVGEDNFLMVGVHVAHDCDIGDNVIIAPDGKADGEQTDDGRREGAREQKDAGQLAVESYLRYQGDKLVERFDANCYVQLTRQMDTHDVSRGRGDYPDVLASITQPTLVIGVDSDVLYPLDEQRELAELCRGLPVEIRTLADFDEVVQVVEDRDTFAANAEKKATQQARHLNHWVLAEDSGLVVDALDGTPGIYSARFSGPQATDEQNNALLLERLRGVAPERRTAHYVCSAALAAPDGSIRARSEGRCHGRIAQQPAGSGGFGYDPLFIVPEYHRTFGQLGPVAKSCLSHRRRAMERIVPEIARLVAE